MQFSISVVVQPFALLRVMQRIKKKEKKKEKKLTTCAGKKFEASKGGPFSPDPPAEFAMDSNHEEI